jgi:poly-gamma-glutamate synthesis protein (capsule biosynthesis protein)
MKKILITFICVAILAACAPATDLPIMVTPVVPSPVPPTATIASISTPEALWISPSVPAYLAQLAGTWNISLTNDPALATQKLDISDPGSLWIYALVAPFPTVTDDVTFHDLSSFWQDGQTGPISGHSILLAESTLRAFTAIWGAPASGVVRVVPPGEMLDTAWNESDWAIIPFEEIQPKWKVVSVDGQSPIHKDFNTDVYPLKIKFGLSRLDSFAMPRSNRDTSKLATVVLTGVTAIVRATALTMELKGLNYPGSLIGDWLRGADVAHISNEVTFDKTCPYPRAGSTSLILCSDPKYMSLLLDVGTDVVEMSGDHLLDRGGTALIDTIAMYKENNMLYYGGGLNAEDARKPVLLEVNGNKIAFMGCNGKPQIFQKATATTPGPAECDYEFFGNQIRELKAQGYMVIFTFQHNECYSAMPCYLHEEGFHSVADAGSVIVSGSQAHFPHIMEFRGDSFIHYGLGNLFFDQMTYILPDGQVIDGTRREFLDRHVFYDGKYLGVELLTAMLEDYSTPRPMTEAERVPFLTEYFTLSGWMPLAPIVIPQPTVTLTPIVLP